MNRTNENYTYWGTCKFDHLVKECNNTPMSMKPLRSIQNPPAVNSLKNAQSGLQIPQIYAQSSYQIPHRYLNAISQARPPILT